METEAPKQAVIHGGTAEESQTAPASGKRQAFRDLKRELSDADLASSGAQKLLLDMLLSAETERDEYKEYVRSYYEANTRTQVLEEKLKGDVTNETLFAVGVGIGGTIIGLAPVYWDKPPAGVITLIVGLMLASGAVVGRLRFRKNSKAVPTTK